MPVPPLEVGDPVVLASRIRGISQQCDFTGGGLVLQEIGEDLAIRRGHYFLTMFLVAPSRPRRPVARLASDKAEATRAVRPSRSTVAAAFALPAATALPVALTILPVVEDRCTVLLPPRDFKRVLLRRPSRANVGCKR